MAMPRANWTCSPVLRAIIAFGVVHACAPVLAAADRLAPEADEDALESIAVTAEKRPATADRTPLAIHALTGEAVLRSGAMQLDDALSGSGALKVSEGAAGPSFYIRGIGTGVPPSVGDPEVNINVDGIYQSQPEQSRSGLYDIDRIEVVRGPQGTLYGRNAVAGVINIVTRDPVFHPEAGATVGVGNFGLLQSQGAVNIPLGETLAVRMAFSSQYHQGYLSNGADDASVQSGRLKLLWHPIGPLRILLGADRTHIGGQGEGEIQVVPPAPGVPAPGAAMGNALASGNPWISPDPGTGTRQAAFWSTHLQLDWDLGAATLTLLPAMRQEEDACSNCWRSESDQKSNQHDRQSSVELRLASNDRSDLTWLAGLYELRAASPNQFAQLPPGADSFLPSSGNVIAEQGQVRFDTSAYAGFGRVGIEVAPSLTATAGLRYSLDRKQEVGYVQSESGGAVLATTGLYGTAHAWHAVTYDAGLQWIASDRLFAYGRLATGYKSGGFFEGAPPDSYDPETLRSVEVGSRLRAFDRRLECSINVFRYDYQHYQVNYLGVIHPDAAGIFGILTANAAGARIQGTEIEARWHFGANTQLELALYPLHAQFRELLVAGPFGGNYTGRVLPFAPRRSANIAAQSRIPLAGHGSVTARLESHLESESWMSFSGTPGSRQPGYAVSNVFFAYDPPGANWSLGAFVRNLANTPVLVNTQPGPGGLLAADLGPPRILGMQWSARFSF